MYFKNPNQLNANAPCTNLSSESDLDEAELKRKILQGFHSPIKGVYKTVADFKNDFSNRRKTKLETT